MGIIRVIAGSLLSLAATAAFGQGGRGSDAVEAFPSRLLDRTVKVAVHVPDPAAVARWQASHPGWMPRLVLFLPGAYDGPKDLLKQGIYADLRAREDAGTLAPSLWLAPEHFKSWYADRKDGSFPYERFLREELLPAEERAHPGFGGARAARTVAGLSMGGFGALNLAARTETFGRCVALSPALVDVPFQGVGFWIRWSLERTFPEDAAGFAPWNPWKHLAGDTALVLGCGTEDKYHLAPATEAFARRCREAGRPPEALILAPGGHDWGFWTPTFERLAPWMAGEPLPADLGAPLRTAAPAPTLEK